MSKLGSNEEVFINFKKYSVVDDNGLKKSILVSFFGPSVRISWNFSLPLFGLTTVQILIETLEPNFIYCEILPLPETFEWRTFFNQVSNIFSKKVFDSVVLPIQPL